MMRIGILGGGQLGRMLVQQMLSYQDEVFVMDKGAEGCSFLKNYIEGRITDYEAVLAFGRDKDIITIEIEQVNTEALAALEAMGKRVVPSANAIALLQSKIAQKRFYEAHHIPALPFYVWGEEGTKEAIKPDFLESAPVLIQKLDQGGYDGRGVQRVLWREREKFWAAPSVLEPQIAMRRELAAVVAIGRKACRCFPVVEMVMDRALHMLDYLISPALLSESVCTQIDAIVSAFSAHIGSEGLFAIELFEDKEGRIWVNETAPRLHNSGHITQEVSGYSQFEQMYRILRGYPLARVGQEKVGAMINLVGAAGYEGAMQVSGLAEVLQMPQVFVHLYGKRQTKAGRKMGHINIVGNDYETVRQQVREIKNKIQIIAK